jgi:dTDP-4-amino-4,6-dideoxygalactose transaminase
VLAEGLRSVPGLRVPEPPAHIRHAYYRFYAYLELDRLRSGWNRDRIVREVTSRGVPCFYGSCPEIYREKAFDGTGYRPADLPVAHELGNASLALLVHPTLGAEHMDHTLTAVRAVLREAIR